MLKKLIKNSLLLGFAPYVSRVVAIFLLPIMTKYLTDVDFGIAGTISAYTLAISAFSTLGFGIVLMNSYYKSPCQYKILWREIYGFLQIWMIIFAIIQAILIYFIVPPEAEENKWLIIILTNFSTVFFGPTALLGSTYYIYKQQAFPIAWRSVMAGLITIFANYIMIVYYRWGYMGWYVGSFAGLFFSNASYWFVVNRKLELSPIFNFKWKTIKHSLKVALPTVPHYYSAYLMNGSGRMVMDRCNVPIAEIGKISIVQQFGTLIESGVGAINQAVNPMAMQEIKNGDENKAKKIIYGYLLVVYAVIFTIALWSKEIFSILISNESLASTYPYFIIFAMALCYRPMYVAASNMFFYHEKTVQLLKITFVSGLGAFLCYIIFIPKFELWAFVIGYYLACLYYGYSGFITKTFREKSKVKYPWLITMVVQIVLTIIAFICVDFIFYYKILILLFFFIALYYFYFKLIKR